MGQPGAAAVAGLLVPPHAVPSCEQPFPCVALLDTIPCRRCCCCCRPQPLAGCHPHSPASCHPHPPAGCHPHSPAGCRSLFPAGCRRRTSWRAIPSSTPFRVVCCWLLPAVGCCRKRNPLEDLRREISIMRRMRHPNIVALTEVRAAPAAGDGAIAAGGGGGGAH